MKVLYLVRHAKSSRDDPSLPDRDRPLDERGKQDAQRLGRRLAKRNVKPDLLVSSPALRARTTAQLIAKELGFERQDAVGLAVADTEQVAVPARFAHLHGLRGLPADGVRQGAHAPVRSVRAVQTGQRLVPMHSLAVRHQSGSNGMRRSNSQSSWVSSSSMNSSQFTS